MSDQIEEQPPQFIMPTERPPHEIGFVIDGIVQETIFVSDRFAAILLSNPIITNVTGANVKAIHTLYDGKKLMTDEDDELTVIPIHPFDVNPS